MNLYMSFRFFLHLPEPDKVLHVSKVYHDLFAPGLWLTKAHDEEEETLQEALTEAGQIHDTALLDVYLCLRNTDPTKMLRRVRVEFDPDEVEWFPLDLDASVAGPAMERVLLRNVEYGEVESVYPTGLEGRAVQETVNQIVGRRSR